MAKLKTLLLAVVATGMLIACSGVCSAFTLLTKEQALEEAFWKDATIETETRELTGQVLETVKDRIGGSLVYYQEGAEDQVVEERTSYDFFFVVGDDGERKAVSVIDTEPGKWGPVTYCITMMMDGSVKSVKVMSFEEQRGRPIARLSYMNQYRGKSTGSDLEVGKDIIGITGATISSRSATFTVKKVLVIYDELFLN